MLQSSAEGPTQPTPDTRGSLKGSARKCRAPYLETTLSLADASLQCPVCERVALWNRTPKDMEAPKDEGSLTSHAAPSLHFHPETPQLRVVGGMTSGALVQRQPQCWGYLPGSGLQKAVPGDHPVLCENVWGQTWGTERLRESRHTCARSFWNPRAGAMPREKLVAPLDLLLGPGFALGLSAPPSHPASR